MPEVRTADAADPPSPRERSSGAPTESSARPRWALVVVGIVALLAVVAPAPGGRAAIRLRRDAGGHRACLADGDGLRARRAPLRGRAGRPPARDQERRAAGDAVPHRDASNSAGERGLLGVAFDPNFATNHFVYVYYTAATPTVHNRVSRFTANGDVAVAGQRGRDPRARQSLAARRTTTAARSTSARTASSTSPSATTRTAPTRRRSRTCSARCCASTPTARSPRDNPFYGTATGANRAIWALGLRNPFTFAFQPGTGSMFINDVGQNTWEEINDGIAGANYGWPDTEGPTTDPALPQPVFAYGHGSGSTTGCAITGGAFYNPPTVAVPERDYVGRLLLRRLLQRLDPQARPSEREHGRELRHRHREPGRSEGGDDGSLYYLARGSGGGSVFRDRLHGEPGAEHHDAPGEPDRARRAASATFTVAAQRHAAARATSGSATASTSRARPRQDYTLASAAAGGQRRPLPRRRHQQRRHRDQQRGDADRHRRTRRRPPRSPQPPSGTLYSGGQTIIATPARDRPRGRHAAGERLHLAGRLPPRHARRTRSSPPTSGATSGSFTIPTTGDTEANVWYRIHLDGARLAPGSPHSTFRDVLPRTVQLTLATSPAGLSLGSTGSRVATPLTFTRRRRDRAHARRRRRRRRSGGTTYEFVSLVGRRRRGPHDLDARPPTRPTPRRFRADGSVGDAGSPRRTSTTATSPARP